MKELATYHRGDTVTVQLRSTGGGISLQDYRIDILLYTTPNGFKPVASTEAAGDCIPVVVPDHERALFTLTPEHTSRLDPGTCMIESRYTHVASGASRLLINKGFILEDSVLADVTLDCEALPESEPLLQE